ncbi:MAG: hypothetical protein QXT77_04290, partial [Candidatus Methanomethylicaceae archaeon]
MDIFVKFGQDIVSSLRDIGGQLVGDYRDFYDIGLMPTISYQIDEGRDEEKKLRWLSFYHHAERAIPFHPLAIFVPKQNVVNTIRITGVPTTQVLSGFESARHHFDQSYIDLNQQFRTISAYKGGKDIYHVDDNLINYDAAFEGDLNTVTNQVARNLAYRYDFVHRVYLPFKDVKEIQFTPQFFNEDPQALEKIRTNNFSVTPSSVLSLVAHAGLFYDYRGTTDAQTFRKYFNIIDHNGRDITEEIYKNLSQLGNSQNQLSYHWLFRVRGYDDEGRIIRYPAGVLYEVYMPHAGGFDANPGRDFLIWTGSLQVYAAKNAPLRFLHVLHNDQMARLNLIYNALADYTLIRNGLFNFIRTIATNPELQGLKSPDAMANITSNVGLLKTIYKAYLLGADDALQPHIVDAIKTGNLSVLEEFINSKISGLSKVLSPYQLALIDKTALEMAKVTKPMVNTAFSSGREFLDFTEDQIFHENLYLANLDPNTNNFHTIVMRLPGVARDNYNRHMFDLAISDAVYSTLQAVYTHDYWQRLLSSAATVIGIGVLGAAAASVIYVLWRKYKFNKEQEKIVKDYAKAQRTSTIKLSGLKIAQTEGSLSVLQQRRLMSDFVHISPESYRDISLLEIQPRSGFPHYVSPFLYSFGTRISFMVPLLNRFQAGDSTFMYTRLAANHAFRDSAAGRVIGYGPSLDVNVRFSGAPMTQTFTVAYVDSPLDISRVLINNFNWGFHSAVLGSLILSTTIVPKIISKIVDDIYSKKEKAELEASRRKLDKEVSFLLKQYSKNIEKYAQSLSIASPDLTSTWGVVKNLGLQLMGQMFKAVIAPTAYILSFV